MNLYFKSSNFNSNIELANYMFSEFKSYGLNPSEPQSDDFMFMIKTTIENESVIFYMGRNDEPSNPALWQIWPEQNISIFSRIFGNFNDQPEKSAKALVEKIVNSINAVSGVEWGI